MKKFVLSALAAVALVGSLAGCASTGAPSGQSLATTLTQDAAAITQVNGALIQLNSTIIANVSQLALALAQQQCPIINATVSLGKAIAADPNVASKAQSVLKAAGSTGVLLTDVCSAVGLGSTATAAPAAAVTATAN